MLGAAEACGFRQAGFYVDFPHPQPAKKYLLCVRRPTREGAGARACAEACLPDHHTCNLAWPREGASLAGRAPSSAWSACFGTDAPLPLPADPQAAASSAGSSSWPARALAGCRGGPLLQPGCTGSAARRAAACCACCGGPARLRQPAAAAAAVGCLQQIWK